MLSQRLCEYPVSNPLENPNASTTYFTRPIWIVNNIKKYAKDEYLSNYCPLKHRISHIERMSHLKLAMLTLERLDSSLDLKFFKDVL